MILSKKAATFWDHVLGVRREGSKAGVSARAARSGSIVRVMDASMPATADAA